MSDPTPRNITENAVAASVVGVPLISKGLFGLVGAGVMLVVRSKRWTERQAFALTRAQSYSRSVSRFAGEARKIVEGLARRVPEIDCGLEAALVEFDDLGKQSTPDLIKRVARDSQGASLGDVKSDIGQILVTPLHKVLDEMTAGLVRNDLGKNEEKQLRADIRQARNKIVRLAYAQIGADVSRDGEYSARLYSLVKIGVAVALTGAAVWFYLEKLA